MGGRIKSNIRADPAVRKINSDIKEKAEDRQSGGWREMWI